MSSDSASSTCQPRVVRPGARAGRVGPPTCWPGRLGRVHRRRTTPALATREKASSLHCSEWSGSTGAFLPKGAGPPTLSPAPAAPALPPHLADHLLVQLGEAGQVKGRQDLAIPLDVREVACGAGSGGQRVWSAHGGAAPSVCIAENHHQGAAAWGCDPSAAVQLFQRPAALHPESPATCVRSLNAYMLTGVQVELPLNMRKLLRSTATSGGRKPGRRRGPREGVGCMCASKPPPAAVRHPRHACSLLRDDFRRTGATNTPSHAGVVRRLRRLPSSWRARARSNPLLHATCLRKVVQKLVLRLLLPKVGDLLAQVPHDEEVDLGGPAGGARVRAKVGRTRARGRLQAARCTASPRLAWQRSTLAAGLAPLTARA